MSLSPVLLSMETWASVRRSEALDEWGRKLKAKRGRYRLTHVVQEKRRRNRGGN